MLQKAAKKFISAALSILLIVTASIPSYAQYDPAPSANHYYICHSNGIAKMSLEGILTDKDRAHHILSSMGESFSQINKAINNASLNRNPYQSIEFFNDEMLKLYSDHIKVLEFNAKALKNLDVKDVASALEGFHNSAFLKFVKLSQAGHSVKNAFLRATVDINASKKFFNHASEIYDIVKANQTPIVLDEAFYTEAGKINYSDILDSFSKSESAIEKLKAKLKARGLSDARIDTIFFTEISNKVSYLSAIDETAKELLKDVNKKISIIEREIQKSPYDTRLKVILMDLRKRKASELRNIHAAMPKFQNAQETLYKLYESNPNFRSNIVNMASQAERKLLEHSHPSKTLGSFHAGGGLLTLLFIVAGTSAVINAGSDALQVDSKAISSRYSNFIKQQKEIVKIIDNAPSLLPVMHHNADAAGKKILRDLAYKDDNAARDIYLINNTFAEEIDNLSEAEITAAITTAKAAVTAERQAVNLIKMQGSLDYGTEKLGQMF